MTRQRIGGDAEDHRSGLGEVAFAIAKRACLCRAAGCVVLGIKVEDHVFPVKLLERHVFAARRGQLKIGRDIAHFGFVKILHQFTFLLPKRTFSATSTALSAELRRRLSQTAHIQNPPPIVGSRRTSATSTSSFPAASIVPNDSSTSGRTIAGLSRSRDAI